MKRKPVEYLLFPPFHYNREKLGDHIRGKTIVITGASYGIGEQVAKEFSVYNVHLILIARSLEKLEQLKQELESNGSKVTVIAANLYEEAEVDTLLGMLKALPGGIDLFISNAGKSIRRPLMESLDRYHDITRTNSLNFLAPAKLLLGLTALFRQKKTQIINISAMNVLLPPTACWAAYQASKTAFDQWFRCHIPEWYAAGITASRVYFPLVRTRMIAPNVNYRDTPAMTPEHAARIVAKLCYTKATIYKPWWAWFAELGGFLGQRLFEYGSGVYEKRKNKKV